MQLFRLILLLLVVSLAPARAQAAAAVAAKLFAEAQCLSDSERDAFQDGFESEQLLPAATLASVFLADSAYDAGRLLRAFLAGPERPTDLRELLRKVGKRAWLTDAEITNSLEVPDCWINFVQMPGPELVVKQVIDPDPVEQRLVVIDAAAHRIAEYASVAANRVKLSPCDAAFPGKVCLERCASVHSLAAGLSCDEELPWEGFTMQQRAPLNPDIPRLRRGLTPAVVATMAQHPALPRIAALDTFVGNADRSKPNLFYERSSNSFTGIDLAAAFTRTLARDALPHIQRIINNEWRLSSAEKRAMAIYSLQLRRLVEDYPPHLVDALLANSLRHAGLWDDSGDIHSCYHQHSRNFRENYGYCRQLLSLLEQI